MQEIFFFFAENTVIYFKM